jgi:hypothetical protein
MKTNGLMPKLTDGYEQRVQSIERTFHAVESQQHLMKYLIGFESEQNKCFVVPLLAVA